jgi:hypothetical protein
VLSADWAPDPGVPKIRRAAQNSGVMASGLCFIFNWRFYLLREK